MFCFQMSQIYISLGYISSLITILSKARAVSMLSPQNELNLSYKLLNREKSLKSLKHQSQPHELTACYFL